MSELFDSEKAEIGRIQGRLQEILGEWKEKLKAPKISYISVRARNEIEVPLTCENNKKYKELIFSSQTSKMIRYVTAETIELSNELMHHEEKMARAYEPFFNMMVKEFCSHKYVWDLYVLAVARLDVLFSLAKVSATMLPRCMPEFVENGLEVRKGHHAGLLQVKARENVVGNTLHL